MIAFSYIWNMG